MNPIIEPSAQVRGADLLSDSCFQRSFQGTSFTNTGIAHPRRTYVRTQPPSGNSPPPHSRRKSCQAPQASRRGISFHRQRPPHRQAASGRLGFAGESVDQERVRKPTSLRPQRLPGCARLGRAGRPSPHKRPKLPLSRISPDSFLHSSSCGCSLLPAAIGHRRT